jgi:hypothetical protein
VLRPSCETKNMYQQTTRRPSIGYHAAYWCWSRNEIPNIIWAYLISSTFPIHSRTPCSIHTKLPVLVSLQRQRPRSRVDVRRGIHAERGEWCSPVSGRDDSIGGGREPESSSILNCGSHKLQHRTSFHYNPVEWLTQHLACPAVTDTNQLTRRAS